MSRLTKKVATTGLAVATVLSLSGAGALLPVAGAATLAELQAQLASIQAAIAALTGGTATGTCYSFTRSLTLGSSGADVTALQDYLTGTGHFTFAGGSTGFFGPVTQAAVAAWQAANGVAPAVGYFGPISQVKYNSMCTTTTGGTGSTGSTTVKSGNEGSMTVTKAPSPASGEELFEAEKGQGIYGFEVKATDSEVYVSRVTLQFNTAIYNILDRVKLYRNGELLAEKSVDSDTVNRVTSSNYTIQLSGFESKVAKDDKGTFTVEANAKSSIDSSYTSFTVLVPADGVRSTDGAGVSLNGPSSALTSNSVTVSQGGASAALLTISKNGSSPDQSYVVADSSGKANKVTLLVMNVKAEKDNIKLTDATTTIALTGVGTTTTAYLYDGDTLVDSAAVSGTSAHFDDFSWTVPKDTTKQLTVKVDFSSITNNPTVATSSITAVASVVAEGSDGIAIASGNKTVSATGAAIYVAKAVPQFSLVSATATKNAGVSGVSSATADVAFKFTVRALGGDLNVTSTNAIVVTPYVDNSATTTLNEAYTVTGATLSGSVYTIAQDTEATFTVSGQINTSGWPSGNDGNYDFRLTDFAWYATSATTTTTTFLDDLSTGTFKTNTVVLK